AARRMLPLYLAAPTIVLFTAVCMDAVFMFFTLTALAWGLSANRRGSVWRIGLAGVSLWLATFLNFAAVIVPVILGLDALLNAAGRWRAGLRALFRTILIGGVFVLCSLLAQYLLGYDLLATVR